MTEENTLISTWRTLDTDATTRSDAARRSRQAYEAERTLAQRTMTELVDRVAAWQ